MPRIKEGPSNLLDLLPNTFRKEEKIFKTKKYLKINKLKSILKTNIKFSVVR